MKKRPAASLKAGLPWMLGGVLLTLSFAFGFFENTPACIIGVDKSNVFYIGVENPVSILVRGVPADQITVTATGVTLTQGEDYHYTARATQPGQASITVSGGNLKPVTFNFRVKRIPDPKLMLGGRFTSRTMGNGEFKAQGGLSAVIENFDFDARCDIVGYEVIYLGKRQDPVSYYNTGARFTSAVQDLIYRAKPGDVYFFDEVKVKCPGDMNARDLGSLVFRIR